MLLHHPPANSALGHRFGEAGPPPRVHLSSRILPLPARSWSSQVGAVDISRILGPGGSTSPAEASASPSTSQRATLPRVPSDYPRPSAYPTPTSASASGDQNAAFSQLPLDAAQPSYAQNLDSSSGRPSSSSRTQPGGPPPGDFGHPGLKRPAPVGPHPLESPAKKQSKWSAEENSLIIQLRGDGMKWDDISKRLPGRSAISCRLHYQNFLERRPDWDEESKNKLARLYERFKRDMWENVAKQLHMPWRAAEAMHWQLGSEGIAQRAGVPVFSKANVGTAPLQPTPSVNTQAMAGQTLIAPAPPLQAQMQQRQVQPALQRPPLVRYRSPPRSSPYTAQQPYTAFPPPPPGRTATDPLMQRRSASDTPQVASMMLEYDPASNRRRADSAARIESRRIRGSLSAGAVPPPPPNLAQLGSSPLLQRSPQLDLSRRQTAPMMGPPHFHEEGARLPPVRYITDPGLKIEDFGTPSQQHAQPPPPPQHPPSQNAPLYRRPLPPPLDTRLPLQAPSPLESAVQGPGAGVGGGIGGGGGTGGGDGGNSNGGNSGVGEGSCGGDQP